MEVVWHQSKDFATHAAAARALDCLCLREHDGCTGDLSLTYGLCQETPYADRSEAPPLPSSMPKRESPSLSSSAPESAAERRQPLTPRPLGKKVVPKAALNSWYDDRYEEGHELLKAMREYYLTWRDKTMPNHENRYTSVFTCPVTGEKFASGRFGDPKTYDVKEETFGGEGAEDAMVPIVAEVVWYSNKKAAEHAAAARALDCFLHRSAGGGEVDKDKPARRRRTTDGLCVEEPYGDSFGAPPFPKSMPNRASRPGRVAATLRAKFEEMDIADDG